METTTRAWNFEATELPYRDQLFKTALRMTRSREDAEDLIQETYLKAYRHYRQYREGTNFKAWLFRIMKNTFINAYRKKKLQPAQVDFEEIESGLESLVLDDGRMGALDPEERFLEAEMDEGVRKAFSELPRDYKVVVLLADLEGFAYKEIAEILEIPVGTVMSRLYRGRRMLERALLAYGVRYNYLRAMPEKFRDRGIDTATFFRENASMVS